MGEERANLVEKVLECFGFFLTQAPWAFVINRMILEKPTAGPTKFLIDRGDMNEMLL